MSRNGSGTYTLPAGNPVVTGTTITTTWANTTLSDIASSLTGSVAADGQTPMSGNFNMANNRIISVLDPTLAQDAATKAYVDAADATNLALTLLKANNLSDVANAATSRTNLGLGTIATQAANAVAITGGTIAGATITGGTISSLSSALPVASGGTGVITSTGSGANVLNTSPTIATPTITGNITDGTYTTSVASAAQGTAKAWANFSYVGSTLTVNASYNCSSITRSAAGVYNFNFTNALVDVNYVVMGSCGSSTANYPSTSYTWISLGAGVYVQTSRSTSTFKFETVVSASTPTDVDTCNIAVIR